MNPKNREVLLGIIALMLLLIYLFALGSLVALVIRSDSQPVVPAENVIWIINLIGGIVTGVVIANLAVTAPGETPMSQVRNMAAAYGQSLMQTVVWLYIGSWLVSGLVTFYVGVISHPDVSATLTGTGKAWLGILAGAAYAWFGIRQP
jgi:amino acid transporter